MKALDDFVALVTDGHPIDGYNKPCPTCGKPFNEPNDRKDRFLALGRTVMKELAKRLGVDPKLVHVNRGGIAVSGDIALDSPNLQVFFYHHALRAEYGDFYARRGRNGRNNWYRWEELLDLNDVAKKIKVEA